MGSRRGDTAGRSSSLSHRIEAALVENPYGLTRRELTKIAGDDGGMFASAIASLSLRVMLCVDDYKGFYIEPVRRAFLDRLAEAEKHRHEGRRLLAIEH